MRITLGEWGNNQKKGCECVGYVPNDKKNFLYV